MSVEETVECPLCMEQLEMDDINFFPCTCGYQICRFCWHRIRTDENGLCPACRKQYPEDPAEFKPLTDDELQRIRKERKQKDTQRKQKAAENRKHLANVRVVQKNLVFVVGLSARLADPEVLKKHEYFGKFGKIHKVVINQSTSYAGAQGPSASAYVTYHRSEDALRAIQAVTNVYVDGRTLKGSLGTTKYCSHFLKGSQCPKPDCMYLHELGESIASFTKEEMQLGKHQEYEQKLHEQLINSPNAPGQLQATTTKQSQPVATSEQKTSSPTTESPEHSPPTSSEHLHNSNKDAWPSLQTKPERLTNGNKAQAKTEAPPHSRAPGNHRHIAQPTNGGPHIALPNRLPPEQKSPPAGSQIIGSNRKHLFGDQLNSDSLFGSSGFPTHRNPNKPNILPTAPTNNTEPSLTSTEIPETIPVASSTDWQAAFGFGSSSTCSNDDDLGFDPWDESSKALADLIEKETGISAYGNYPQRHPPGFQVPSLSYSATNHLKTSGPPAGSSKMLGLMHLTPEIPSANTAFPDMFSDRQQSLPSNSQSDALNMKDWQDNFKALLPNINISFGAPPSQQMNRQQSQTMRNGWSPSNAPTDWLAQDPAIVTSGDIADNNHLSESPPHWMRSLHQLTENDSSNHRLPFVQQFNLRNSAWPTQSQTPPPGFNSQFRPPTQATEPQKIAQGLK